MAKYNRLGKSLGAHGNRSSTKLSVTGEFAVEEKGWGQVILDFSLIPVGDDAITDVELNALLSGRKELHGVSELAYLESALNRGAEPCNAPPAPLGRVYSGSIARTAPQPRSPLTTTGTHNHAGSSDI